MLEAYVCVIVGFLGLSVGSFLNVVVLRGEREESLMGRSHCPECKKTLKWYELVPVFSYLVQCGRCRGCRSRISIQYPLVELATSALFIFLAHKYLLDPALVGAPYSILHTLYFILHACIWSLLIAIFVYDLRTKFIPDLFSYTFAAIALLSTLLTADAASYTSYSLLHTLYSGPLLALPFYLLWKLSRGTWMGLGDAKLALGIGWYLGLSGGAAAAMLAFWIGAIVSLLLVGVAYLRAQCGGHTSGERLTMKSEVPFGPYLVVGTAAALFFELGIFDLLVW